MRTASSRKGRGLNAEDLARLTAERAAARAEARAHEGRMQETASLARGRGEAVEEVQGRLRVTSRDGLQSLFEQGGLERPEYEAGMMYRRCYETLSAGPRSNLAGDLASGVRGFSEALRHEFEGSNLSLTVVHPGGIATEIARSARIPQGIDPVAARAASEEFTKQLKTSPAKAALDITNAILKRKPRLLIGGDAKFIDKLQRIFPETYWRRLQKLMSGITKDPRK